MPIFSIETFLLETPIQPGFGWSQGWTDKRQVGLVKLVTDDGIVGWGEGLSGSSAQIVHQEFAPLLLGADPMQRNGLWQKMFHIFYNGNVAGGIGGSAISAVDTALWTSPAKRAGCPSARSSAEKCATASPSTPPVSTIQRKPLPPMAPTSPSGCWTRPACTWSLASPA